MKQRTINFHDVVAYLFEKKRIFQLDLDAEKANKSDWSSNYRNARNGINICRDIMEDLYLWLESPPNIILKDLLVKKHEDETDD